MAVALAAILAGQMLPSSQRVAVLGVAVVVVLMVSRHVQHSTGLVWESRGLRGQVPFLVVVLSVVLATAVVVAATGLSWVWVVGAAVAAVVVLVTGARYNAHSPA